MSDRTLGASDLEVSRLCLGGNVFGWTADEQESFAVLDAFAEGGGTFVDTADVYSVWVDGNRGGESEEILGRWMAARGNRDSMVIATKVAKHPDLRGLSPENVRKAVEGSLTRLGTDVIDLYYAHEDDEATPLEQTLGVFDELVREGKVRTLGASNFSAARLAESLSVSEREGLASYVAVQPQYNLVERDEYEGELAGVVTGSGLSCVPYYGLASGFLTGKYRPGQDVDSARAGTAGRYLDDRGTALLGVLDDVAAAHDTTVAAVSLAWLVAQPGVTSAIASARTPRQLADLLPVDGLELTGEEVARLDAA